MASESFLLVSLQEDKAKKLAQVINNDTCRKILEFLAHGEATETAIAEKLGMPLSTVHYNLQLLVEGNLVVTEEFHYSQKGREILHYKLANKYIIIAPTDNYDFMEKLKKVLPLGVFALAFAGVLQLYTMMKSGTMVAVQKVAEVGGQRAYEAARVAEDAAVASSPVAVEGAKAAAQQVGENAPALMTAAPKEEVIAQATNAVVQSTQFNIALWFLFGAIFTLVVYLIWDYIHFKRKR